VAGKKQVVLQLMDAHFAALRTELQTAFTTLEPDLPPDERAMIGRQIDSWAQNRTWAQINELSASRASPGRRPRAGQDAER
jgi:hypothetical protein